MIRRLLFVFLLVVLATSALGQQRYTVTLRFDADDDPEVITRQLAATYRLQVDPADAGTATMTVTATDSAIALLRTDRRVVAVETARPSVVATDAAGFGTYAYDGAGNITQVGDDTFDYDKHGRIKNATIASVKQTFTYDRWGNITKIATAGEADLSIAVAPNNRLSGASYDASGNLTSYHGGTFVYDALNVVKESTPTGGNRHLYLYSASNERIASIELVGAQQQSEWTVRDDAGKVLRRFSKSLSGQWAWNEDYIYRGSLLLAAEVPSPEKIRHFHLDHLGTPRLITGNGGAVIAKRSYGAFGRGLHVESTPAPDELAQFTGHERDSFQLDYMHARYYDPMLGRFLSVDPVLDFNRALREPQRWNRYSYVVNNPINRIDPDGRADVTSEVASGVFGFLPGAGEFQDATIALTGYDPITAEKQSGWVRAASVATVLIPFVGGKALGEGAEATARIVGNAIAGARFEKAALSALGVADVAKTRIPSLSGTAAYRVPDALTAKSLIEVKGVAKLGATNQIKDFATFAKESGRQFILVVRKDTILTKELEKMAADGLVRIQRQ